MTEEEIVLIVLGMICIAFALAEFLWFYARTQRTYKPRSRTTFRWDTLSSLIAFGSAAIAFLVAYSIPAL